MGKNYEKLVRNDLLKTKPTLNKLRMGKNCYEKEKLSLK